MPTLKQKFIVQKVKNNQIQTDKANNFNKLPELYLELIVNKDNIIESKKNYNDNYNDYQDNYQDTYKDKLISEDYKSNYNSSNYSDTNYSDSDSDSDSASDYSDDSRSRYSDSSSSSDDSNLSIRLKNLLKDDGNDINLDNINQKTEYIAPSLNDLQKKGEIEPTMNIPNISNNFINEEEEEDKKENYYLNLNY